MIDAADWDNWFPWGDALDDDEHVRAWLRDIQRDAIASALRWTGEHADSLDRLERMIVVCQADLGVGVDQPDDM